MSIFLVDRKVLTNLMRAKNWGSTVSREQHLGIIEEDVNNPEILQEFYRANAIHTSRGYQN